MGTIPWPLFSQTWTGCNNLRQGTFLFSRPSQGFTQVSLNASQNVSALFFSVNVDLLGRYVWHRGGKRSLIRKRGCFLWSCISDKTTVDSLRYENSSWNYIRSLLHADVLFICESITDVMAREDKLPNVVRKAQLRTRISQVPGCIGIVDGTLCRTRMPNCSEHRAYFNGRKKMYRFNTSIVDDHEGLFIFVSTGCARSFHDARVLRETTLGRH